MRLFESEIDAMREHASATEILAKYDQGLITCTEILAAAWMACWDRPELQVELIRQFRAHSNEFVQLLVGDELANLSATYRSRDY